MPKTGHLRLRLNGFDIELSQRSSRCLTKVKTSSYIKNKLYSVYNEQALLPLTFTEKHPDMWWLKGNSGRPWWVMSSPVTDQETSICNLIQQNAIFTLMVILPNPPLLQVAGSALHYRSNYPHELKTDRKWALQIAGLPAAVDKWQHCRLQITRMSRGGRAQSTRTTSPFSTLSTGLSEKVKYSEQHSQAKSTSLLRQPHLNSANMDKVRCVSKRLACSRAGSREEAESDRQTRAADPVIVITHSWRTSPVCVH